MQHFLRAGTAFSSILVVLAAPQLWAETTMNEHRIKSPVDDSIELYARERLPEGQPANAMEEAVLFVHGATYLELT